MLPRPFWLRQCLSLRFHNNRVLTRELQHLQDMVPGARFLGDRVIDGTTVLREGLADHVPGWRYVDNFTSGATFAAIDVVDDVR
eukprot:SAG22_NODE_2844_length_2161_cov_4.195441_2_plen_84_part_00